MYRTLLLAGFIAAGTGVAVAQVAVIPNPSNPTPDYPVATDGSPLPRATGRAFVAAPAADGFVSVYRGGHPVHAAHAARAR